MNIVNSISCNSNDGGLFVIAWCALTVLVGAIAGYIRRRQVARQRGERRRASLADFFGQIFISVFVGMLILMFAISKGYIKLFGTGATSIVDAATVCSLMALGSYLSPVFLSFVEARFKNIFDKFFPGDSTIKAIDDEVAKQDNN